jgi:hypothetical protein
VNADYRVTFAREALGWFDRGDWSDPVNAAGQLAGALRQLLTLADDALDEDQDYDVTGITASGGARLSPADALVLAQALADAVAHRNAGPCADCAAEYGGLCYKHVADEERADAYAALGRALGIEVPQ